jgi:hypothetical protein
MLQWKTNTCVLKIFVDYGHNIADMYIEYLLLFYVHDME